MSSNAPTHQQLLARCRQSIPPLSQELHKGQAGRIGVIGGSADYSGAPYFASMSTLRIGADLAHVICEPAAGNIIKTYSPDLIVHTDLGPDSTDESLTELFNGLLPRLHVLVIGPGLGRSDHMQNAARVAIRLARERGTYIVVDADGLWLVQRELDTVKGYKRVVLTPNVVEFGRLCEAAGLDKKGSDGKDADPATRAAQLADVLGGVTILEKGQVDRITRGTQGGTWESSAQGSVRRCGGQGDVLSGAVGTFLAWGASHSQREGRSDADEDMTRLAAYAGSTLTRTASRLTFARLKRAMQTGDMLNDVGNAFEEVFGDRVVEEDRGVPDGEESKGRL